MGRTTAILWIALGFASGILGTSVERPSSWFPSAAIVAGGLRLGVPAGVSVAAAVFSGALAASKVGCAAAAPDGPRWVSGFATEAAPDEGPVQFRATASPEGRTGQCSQEVPVYRHRGALLPGLRVQVLVTQQDDRRGRPVWVADSIRPDEGSPGIRVRTAAALVRVRVELDARIAKTVGPDATAMASALISGRRGEVPRAVRDDFSRAGTAHLLAISGFHVGVIAGLFALGAAMLGAGPRTRSIVAVCLVWGYVAMIGWPASGVRAAGLLTALGVGRLMGRPTRRLPALASVFFVCLLFRPEALGGIGFQLSFAASLGIVVGRAWPDRWWATVSAHLPGLASGTSRWGGRFVQRCLENSVRGAAVAAGATMPTIPLVAWHFGTVSLVSIPATLCSMPLAAASIVAVLVAVAADGIVPFLAPTLGAGAAWILELLALSVHLWAQLPFAAVATSERTAGALALAAVLVMALLRSSPQWTVGVATVLMGWIAASWMAQGWHRISIRDTVEVFFIDVGQGDAVLVRTPGNRWTLVDAGPANAGWDAGVRRVAPVLNRFGVRKLETMILTHADADHVGGAAAILRRFDVGTVVDPGTARGTLPFIAALEEAERGHTPWRRVRAGEQWEVDGVQFVVLSPDSSSGSRSTNEDSVVVLIRYGRFETLLTGDASTEVERRILHHLPDSLEVLKVGHHGSLTSTDPDLLRLTAPALAVISVGSGNRYGHPAPRVLERLDRHGARILRTDRHGTIGVEGSEDGSFRVTTSR